MTREVNLCIADSDGITEVFRLEWADLLAIIAVVVFVLIINKLLCMCWVGHSLLSMGGAACSPRVRVPW